MHWLESTPRRVALVAEKSNDGLKLRTFLSRNETFFLLP